MKNELKDGSVLTIGSCKYVVKESTAIGFYASVVQPDKKTKTKVDEKAVDEKTIKDTFGKKDTKE